MSSPKICTYIRSWMLLDRLRGKPRRLSYAGIDSILTDIVLELESDNNAPAWLKQGVEPAKLLELLYRLEVVGIEKPSVLTPAGREWEGYDFVFARPKARPEQSGSFLFHPGLWRALDLV